MIAEALEAAWMVASALAAWIVAGVVAVTVGLYAVVVAGWGIWRALAAAMPRRGPLRGRGAPETPSRVSADTGGAPDAVGGHTGLPARPESPAMPPSRPRSPRQSAPQAPGGPFPAPNPERASEARIRPRPTWSKP